MPFESLQKNDLVQNSSSSHLLFMEVFFIFLAQSFQYPKNVLGTSIEDRIMEINLIVHYFGALEPFHFLVFVASVEDCIMEINLVVYYFRALKLCIFSPFGFETLPVQKSRRSPFTYEFWTKGDVHLINQASF